MDHEATHSLSRILAAVRASATERELKAAGPGPGAAAPRYVTRLLRPDDLPAVASLDRQLTGRVSGDALRERTDLGPLETSSEASIVAEADGTLAGYLIVSVDGHSLGTLERVAVVELVGVHPAWRRRGIARSLFACLGGRLRELKIERLRAELDWREPELLNLFVGAGFVAAPRVCLEAATEELPLP